MKNKIIYILVAMMLLTMTVVSALGTWTDLRSADAGNWAGTKQVVGTAYDSTNGLIYTCLSAGGLGVFNLSDGVWTDLSATDAGDWVGATANMGRCVIDPVTGYLYTGGSNGRFGYYNPSDNTWNSLMTADPGDWIGTTTTGSMTMITFDPVNRLIFTSYNTVAKWGVYNISDGVFYDLSTTDAGGWTDSLRVLRSVIDTEHNLLYMYWYSALNGGNNNDFGIYNLSDGILYDKSSLIPWYHTNQFVSSSELVGGKIYLGIAANDEFAGLFGVYDPETDTFTDLSATDAGDWVNVSDMSNIRADRVNNKIYTTGYFCNPNGKNFGVYDINSNVWTDLASVDVNDWTDQFGLTDLTCDNYVTQTTFDSVNERLYMFGYNGRMAMYDVNSNVLYDLSASDDGNWMSGAVAPVGISEDVNYAAAMRVLDDGRIITSYATNYFGIYTFCMENWVRHDTTCLHNERTEYYLDANTCGTTEYMPANVIYSCGGGGFDQVITRAAETEAVPVNVNTESKSDAKTLIIVAGIAVIGYLIYSGKINFNGKKSRGKKRK